MQNEYVAKEAAITIRVPEALKRRLLARAASQHRSLSAQVVVDLELALEGEGAPMKGRFLGHYEGTRTPTDEDLEEVRGLLWGQLGRLEDLAS